MSTSERADRSTCIFRADDDFLVPTPLANGPQYPDTMHGSPMIAALARALERLPSDGPSQITRLTVDMLRAAPMAPIRTDASVLKPGRRVEWLEATLSAGGETFAVARAMRFRVADIPVPADFDARAIHAPGPRLQTQAFKGWSSEGIHSTEAFHHSLEVRPVLGFETPTLWTRFVVPLVEGESNSPLIRVAVASDFAYSVSIMRRISSDPSLMARREFAPINPDTTLNLHRPLVGEWVCLDSRSVYEGLGAGSVYSVLYDEEGPIGHVSQSILVREGSRAE